MDSLTITQDELGRALLLIHHVMYSSLASSSLSLLIAHGWLRHAQDGRYILKRNE